MADHKIIFDHFIQQTPVTWKRAGASGKFRWTEARIMKQAKQVIAWEIKAAEPQLRCDDKARFGYHATFCIRFRCDGDNLEKLLLDSLQGVVWANDEQVDEASWSKKISHHAGIQLVIYKIE